MNYTIYIASHDYGNMCLDKSGNKYVITVYITGYRITKREEFDNFEEAKARYFAMCKNSGIEPTEIEHDFSDIYAYCD